MIFILVLVIVFSSLSMNLISLEEITKTPFHSTQTMNLAINKDNIIKVISSLKQEMTSYIDVESSLKALEQIPVESFNIRVENNFDPTNYIGDFKVFVDSDELSVNPFLQGIISEEGKLYIDRTVLDQVEKILNDENSPVVTFLKMQSEEDIVKEMLFSINKTQEKLGPSKYIEYDLSEDINEYREVVNAILSNRNIMQSYKEAMKICFEGYNSTIFSVSTKGVSLELSTDKIFEEMRNIYSFINGLSNEEIEKRVNVANDQLEKLLVNYYTTKLAKYDEYEDYGATEKEIHLTVERSKIDANDIIDFKTQVSIADINNLQSEVQKTLSNFDFNLKVDFSKDSVLSNIEFYFNDLDLLSFSHEFVIDLEKYSCLSKEERLAIKNTSKASESLIPVEVEIQVDSYGEGSFYFSNFNSGPVDTVFNNGTIYLPLKMIASELNIEIYWDQSLKAAYTNLNNEKVIFQSKVIDGVSYVKLRDFEKLGFEVVYEKNGYGSTIIIKEK